jgi:hypothetical protein
MCNKTKPEQIHIRSLPEDVSLPCRRLFLTKNREQNPSVDKPNKEVETVK